MGPLNIKLSAEGPHLKLTTYAFHQYGLRNNTNTLGLTHKKLRH